MNEYRFDGLDAVVDQDGKIIYDDVTQRTGDIIAGLLENSEVYDAECDRLAAKLGDVMAERDALRQRLAELEAAQRWVPVEDDFIYNGANGDYERMVIWYDGVLRVSGLDRSGEEAVRSVRLPDDVRLCRLVATPISGEGVSHAQ